MFQFTFVATVAIIMTNMSSSVFLFTFVATVLIIMMNMSSSVFLFTFVATVLIIMIKSSSVYLFTFVQDCRRGPVNMAWKSPWQPITLDHSS